jgi:hypothetical protein
MLGLNSQELQEYGNKRKKVILIRDSKLGIISNNGIIVICSFIFPCLHVR